MAGGQVVMFVAGVRAPRISHCTVVHCPGDQRL